MLYSHDTQGLGHVRRNIEIARALVRERPTTDVLIVTGAPEAAYLPRPEHTDLVVLPPVSKNLQGEYTATTLDVSLTEILHLRGSLVAAAVSAFRPDLIIVDKEARGLQGELDQALAVAAHTIGFGTGRRTRLVLGLRDILDTAMTVRREWQNRRTVPTLRVSYDAIWVYGDQSVHDPLHEIGLPADLLARAEFTGYLSTGRHQSQAEPPAEKFVLGLVGGGQDGLRLAENFVETPMPNGHQGILVAGPYMPAEARERLQARAEQRPDLTVLGFVADPSALVAGASAVVTMGGYNSVCEVLASGRPGLIVPRVRPRREQAIRAEAMAARTHLDELRPDDLSPAALGSWLASVVEHENTRPDIDLDGLQRIPRLAADLLAAPVPNSKELADVIA
ncbi:glycosyltransferase family protein [Kineosporia babensis]